MNSRFKSVLLPNSFIPGSEPNQFNKTYRRSSKNQFEQQRLTRTTGTFDETILAKKPSTPNPFNSLAVSRRTQEPSNDSEPTTPTTTSRPKNLFSIKVNKRNLNKTSPSGSGRNIFKNLRLRQGSQKTAVIDQFADKPPNEYLNTGDYNIVQRDLEDTKLSNLNNQTYTEYYKDLIGSEKYQDLLTSELAKTKAGNADEKTAKLGYFRAHLYKNQLRKAIFNKDLSPGQKRDNYEVLNDALNASLGTTDNENPLNIEMQERIIPEMMKLMAADGIKVIIEDSSGNKTEHPDNQADARQEYVFKMDNNMWRTQIGDSLFGKYAEQVLDLAENPNSEISYREMYRDANKTEITDFTNSVKKLDGKENEIIQALKSSSRTPEQSQLIADAKVSLEMILNNPMRYKDSSTALANANSILGGDKNALAALLVYLVQTPVKVKDSEGKTIEITQSNIFDSDDKGNAYLNNPELKAELLKKLNSGLL